MKIVGIIPSRYNSVRFPGKALADLDGTPMVCRVCQSALNCKLLDEIHVATDSPEIRAVCEERGFSVIMTGSHHENPTSRMKEVSDRIRADRYVMIGGDEPLLTAADIGLVIGSALSAQKAAGACPETEQIYVVNAMTAISRQEEAADPTNIKIVCGEGNLGLYASRLPIPFSGKEPSSPHRKFVSIGVYTKEALDFFAAVSPGPLELAEECDLLRFMEHKKNILFADIKNHTHSVDTPKDLELVQRILQKRRTDEQQGTTL